MPRTRASAAAAAQNPNVSENPIECEKPAEPEERVDLDGDNEDTKEEEVESEEVEEEVEEIEEEEEEEVEEEVEEDEEEEDTYFADAQKDPDGDDEIKSAKGEVDNENRRHAELLALPPHGSEVYLGGIPNNASEEDLRGFCEPVGEVTEVRILKGKDSAETKGYAFVTFRTKELASKAMEELNNAEIKGRKIKCSASQVKHRLFISNVPRTWEEEDMKKVVTEIGPGVNLVELWKDPQNSSRNRGFAFIEYYNHACAEYSRKKMSNPKFKLDNNASTVSWADPKNVESSAASQVKAVYIKNLPKYMTQDQLRELFGQHGKITKVVIPPAKAGQENCRFGFVHFAERSSAMKALKNTEKYEIDGHILGCSLAKPQADKKFSGGSNSQKSALLPSYPPWVGYGLLGGAPGAGYGAAGFGQPLTYGRGLTSAGTAMMPMLLPDGRIGYVLQQPGMQPYTPPSQPRSDRSGGGSTSGGRHSGDRGYGRRWYNPY
ncbi:Heterogeneous nuclear ribonucleoprotein Q [Vitis vinifera]|uniref:Heterogeneous nuclear ribonucleoprotein Q n=1 Tax=Vitis vinifera TaxID=29760 RepID=A0A438JST6_VITVI|nr:Heterogeneous nuclear ribonucleoprotein Q [Vitis vinifera]